MPSVWSVSFCFIMQISYVLHTQSAEFVQQARGKPALYLGASARYPLLVAGSGFRLSPKPETPKAASTIARLADCTKYGFSAQRDCPF